MALQNIKYNATLVEKAPGWDLLILSRQTNIKRSTDTYRPMVYEYKGYGGFGKSVKDKKGNYLFYKLSSRADAGNMTMPFPQRGNNFFSVP
jgi:hypothetical protein